MRKIPSDRKYTEGHLWFMPAPAGVDANAAQVGEVGLIGITDVLQARLGDIISAELPRPGVLFAAHDVIASLEGMLETFEVAAFANMEVLEINPRLEIHPDIINRQPYGDGWILKVRLAGVPRWLDAPGYAEFLEKGTIIEGA